MPLPLIARGIASYLIKGVGRNALKGGQQMTKKATESQAVTSRVAAKSAGVGVGAAKCKQYSKITTSLQEVLLGACESVFSVTLRCHMQFWEVRWQVCKRYCWVLVERFSQ